MFGDDRLLLLDGTPDNLDRAIEVINKFGAASGAKLNLHKFVGVWVSHTPRAWTWGEEVGLKMATTRRGNQVPRLPLWITYCAKGKRQ